MKRLGIGTLALVFSACCWLVAATSHAALAQAPAPDFGSPPSGAIPILYNDHHVYSKPDTLRQGRVLAALVRNGTVLIPLRSMFEQMGATVSYDPSSRTVTVSKAGAEVQVTVGRPEVVVNGEQRPLDVPPMMYHGTVLVPVRVISEGMGAYVLWVPDQHVVVVRYIPPTPPPPPPTEAPPPPPTPAPPPPPHRYYDAYISGDYIISPKIYNEFSPGNKGRADYDADAAIEFRLWNIPWMVAGDYRSFTYNHNCANQADPDCLVTDIGGGGQSFVGQFSPRDQNVDAQLGIRILQPRIYLGVGYLWTSNNYGYPSLRGWGFGLNKLPDLDHSFSLFGSIFYFPTVQGTYWYNATPYQLSYRYLKYRIGVDWVLGHSPLFIQIGWLGQSGNAATYIDPSSTSATGPFAGIGVKLW